MAKEIDRVRARSALESVKEQPVIAAIAALPVLVILGIVGVVAGWGWALLLLLALGGVAVWRGRLLK
ncbi:hypothetical protein LTV02_24080 [Nocardia yamanashiensis]|uniref:hypothetical protein n=1 Tax=Nocardia yamanashiensis TaxID=209247 RepID=UPI00082D5025|nr:hypothetical protein [Nocardia yamanashiensis]UGT39164.1 hypothetical protein LTV02_24080 [Nocardia yamanashiensis]